MTRMAAAKSPQIEPITRIQMIEQKQTKTTKSSEIGPPPNLLCFLCCLLFHLSDAFDLWFPKRHPRAPRNPRFFILDFWILVAAWSGIDLL